MNIPISKIVLKKHGENRRECVQFHVNSKIFRSIFQKIIETSLSIINKNSLRQAFLRGHFAADGGIETRKNKKSIQIGHVIFAYHKTKEIWLRNYIIECLKLEGIESIKTRNLPNKETAFLRITLWRDFVKLWKIRLFDRCLRKKSLFLNVVKSSNFYFELNQDFRKFLFSSLKMTQKNISKLINCSSEGETCDIIHGKHLLRIEQIKNILDLKNMSWSQIVNNSLRFRIGNVGYIPLDSDLVSFVLKEKGLV